MKLLLILLLALQGKPTGPASNPNDPDDTTVKQILDVDVTVPKDGNLVVPFVKVFEQPPSCTATGPTIPGEQIKVTEKQLTIKAGQGKIHVHCFGIKAGGHEKPT